MIGVERRCQSAAKKSQYGSVHQRMKRRMVRVRQNIGDLALRFFKLSDYKRSNYLGAESVSGDDFARDLRLIHTFCARQALELNQQISERYPNNRRSKEKSPKNRCKAALLKRVD